MTGKLIKWAILENENKFNWYANALDCHYKLKRDVNKGGLTIRRYVVRIGKEG